MKATEAKLLDFLKKSPRFVEATEAIMLVTGN